MGILRDALALHGYFELLGRGEKKWSARCCFLQKMRLRVIDGNTNIVHLAVRLIKIPDDDAHRRRLISARVCVRAGARVRGGLRFCAGGLRERRDPGTRGGNRLGIRVSA